MSSIFFEVLIGGLLSGTMYALVALGFVLIFKASQVFNFSQGAMVFFAALNVVGFLELGLPMVLAIAATTAVIFLTAVLTERLILSRMVAQSHVTLFMATLGLAYILEGMAQFAWGTTPRSIDLGIPDIPIMPILDRYNILISQFDIFAACIAIVLVTVITVYFQMTRIGRALRAVADDPQAAMSIGVRMRTIWIIVWTLAGMVALVTGLLWGARNGVQHSLTFIALKAFPVLIIGGFNSVPGAIIAGMLVGASEKLFEFFVGTSMGGGTESWFPYMLALLFLMVRPQGLFGDPDIRRV